MTTLPKEINPKAGYRNKLQDDIVRKLIKENIVRPSLLMLMQMGNDRRHSFLEYVPDGKFYVQCWNAHYKLWMDWYREGFYQLNKYYPRFEVMIIATDEQPYTEPVDILNKKKAKPTDWIVEIDNDWGLKIMKSQSRDLAIVSLETKPSKMPTEEPGMIKAIKDYWKK